MVGSILAAPESSSFREMEFSQFCGVNRIVNSPSFRANGIDHPFRKMALTFPAIPGQMSDPSGCIHPDDPGGDGQFAPVGFATRPGPGRPLLPQPE